MRVSQTSQVQANRFCGSVRPARCRPTGFAGQSDQPGAGRQVLRVSQTSQVQADRFCGSVRPARCRPTGFVGQSDQPGAGRQVLRVKSDQPGAGRQVLRVKSDQPGAEKSCWQPADRSQPSWQSAKRFGVSQTQFPDNPPPSATIKPRVGGQDSASTGFSTMSHEEYSLVQPRRHTKCIRLHSNRSSTVATHALSMAVSAMAPSRALGKGKGSGPILGPYFHSQHPVSLDNPSK